MQGVNEMSEADYDVEKENYGKYTLIRFKNYSKLDLYNSRELVEIFKDLNSQNQTDIVVDMVSIEFIDSSGLGAIANQGIYLSKISKRLNLVNVQSAVSHLFKASGFDRIFHLHSGLSNLPQ